MARRLLRLVLVAAPAHNFLVSGCRRSILEVSKTDARCCNGGVVVVDAAAVVVVVAMVMLLLLMLLLLLSF